MRRTWFKLYCDNWLRGSLRRESPALRGIWADLLAMAGDYAFGDDGVIERAKGLGFTDETIAGVLNVPAKLWIESKERLSNHPEAGENRIKLYALAGGYGIRILNWKKYQSEYQRQKPYRSPSTPPLREECSERDEDTEEEGETERAITQVTDKVTEKVTDPLPPIPEHLNFKVQDQLREKRRNIRMIARSLKNPDKESGFCTEEELSKLKEEYCQLIEDYK